MDLSHLQSRLLPNLSSSTASSSSSIFPPHRTQLHPRLLSPQTRSVKPWIWIPISLLLALPILYHLLTLFLHKPSVTTQPAKSSGFGVIIDAGPIRSRIHVFEFLSEGRIPFVGFDGKGSVSMKAGAELRDFAEEPEKAGEGLKGLIEFAHGRIPEKEWGETKVWLLENGGLVGVGMDVRRRILESCRVVLRDSGFRFRDEWASSITGQEKSIHAWVAANYVLGTLGTNPQDTTGIIELGGSSVQITFVPKEPPPMEYSRMLKLSGITYNLYSSKIHHFGQDAAWKSLVGMHISETSKKPSSFIGESVISPCIPRGYNQTSDQVISSSAIVNDVGNFSACRLKVLTFLQGEDVCPHPPCRIIDKILPELQRTSLSVEKFFYTSELFGLVPRSSLLDVEAAGHHYCEDSWNKLKEEHNGTDESDLLKYCFSTAYIIALLHDGLGISMDDKRIGFADPVQRSPFDWTLGTFILQTMEPKFAAESTVSIAGSDAIAYISLFTILFLAILALTIVSKWQKPRFKTIYDLEKGHYIVTRLPK